MKAILKKSAIKSKRGGNIEITECEETFNGYIDILHQCPEIINDDTKFLAFLNALSDHPTKVYYFDLSPEKATDFNMCQGLDPALYQGTKVQFMWETVLAFGTLKQKKYCNNFRRKYISYLINSHCKNDNSSFGNKCKYSIIGTPATSPESDMDFDLDGDNIANVIENIQVLHNDYFKDGLDVMFDVNLYGSVFDFDIEQHNKPSPEMIKLQDTWSWMRTADCIREMRNITFDNVFTSTLDDFHMKIFNDALNQSAILHLENDEHVLPQLSKQSSQTLFNALKKTLNSAPNTPKQITYSKRLDDYQFSRKNSSSLSTPRSSFSSLGDEIEHANMFEQIVELFSKAKYFENETYRSLGAVLDIVQRRQNLHEAYYIHSIFDNFGFVVENLVQKKLCKTSLDKRLHKVSKYVSRICEALQKTTFYNRKNEPTKIIDNLSSICKQLNNARRQENNEKETDILTNNLKTLVQPYVTISSTNTSFDFLIALYNILIKGLHSEQSGGRKPDKKRNTKTKTKTIAKKN